MIRPEAAATLRRWREAISGLGLAGAGIWLLATSGGLGLLFGLALALLGGFLALSGIRQARFRTEAEAPGLVEVIEGQITYLGPVMGGTVALDLLTAVVFRRSPGGEGFWRLDQQGGRPLYIPEGARGSEALLGALSPLPGLDGGAMVRATRRREPGTVTVWQRDAVVALQ